MPQAQSPRIRCRGLPALRLLVAMAVGLSNLAVLGQPQSALRAQSRERSMFVSVIESGGTPVEGLVTADFVIKEDGVEREVLRVGRARAPMQLAVLVDTSGSAAFAIGDVRNGLEVFFSRLLESNELTLVTFGGPPRILVESTDQIDRLRDGIGHIFAYSDSAAYLLDALIETARGFERRESPRPVIVVLTSEGIDYSTHSSEQALEALQANHVATHVILLKNRMNAGLGQSLFGDRDRADSLYQRDRVLERGPRTTGGQRRDLLTSSATPDALDDLAGIITSQYEVVYSRPASLIPPEEITVRMRRNDLTAQGIPARQTRD